LTFLYLSGAVAIVEEVVAVGMVVVGIVGKVVAEIAGIGPEVVFLP